MRMVIIAVALGLVGCAGQSVNIQQACSTEATLAAISPLVSAADLTIPTAGPAVAAANTALVAAANGVCADPVALQLLINQLQAVQKKSVPK